jgi:hypothetical protein
MAQLGFVDDVDEIQVSVGFVVLVDTISGNSFATV